MSQEVNLKAGVTKSNASAMKSNAITSKKL